VLNGGSKCPGASSKKRLLLRGLISLVYKSLFALNDTGYRQAHLLSKVAFIASLALYVAKAPGKAYLPAMIIALSALYPGVDWAMSAIALSLIAGSAATIAALPAVLAGAPIAGLLVAPVSAINVVLSTLFSLAIVSPTEVYNIVQRLGGKRVSGVALATWTYIASCLKQLLESLDITAHFAAKCQEAYSFRHVAKSVLESCSFFEEQWYLRLRTPAELPVAMERSYKYTAILLLATLVVTFLGST